VTFGLSDTLEHTEAATSCFSSCIVYFSAENLGRVRKYFLIITGSVMARMECEGLGRDWYPFLSLESDGLRVGRRAERDHLILRQRDYVKRTTTAPCPREIAVVGSSHKIMAAISLPLDHRHDRSGPDRAWRGDGRSAGHQTETLYCSRGPP
jgi:hypothetical protein